MPESIEEKKERRNRKYSTVAISIYAAVNSGKT